MNIIEITRQFAEFSERFGVSPNAVIVSDNPDGLTKIAGLLVIVDEYATKPIRVALVLL
jgi:hypothetical protein